MPARRGPGRALGQRGTGCMKILICDDDLGFCQRVQKMVQPFFCGPASAGGSAGSAPARGRMMAPGRAGAVPAGVSGCGPGHRQRHRAGAHPQAEKIRPSCWVYISALSGVCAPGIHGQRVPLHPERGYPPGAAGLPGGPVRRDVQKTEGAAGGSQPGDGAGALRRHLFAGERGAQDPGAGPGAPPAPVHLLRQAVRAAKRPV